MAEKLLTFSTMMATLASGLRRFFGCITASPAVGYLSRSTLLVGLLIAYQGQTFRHLRQMRERQVLNTSLFSPVQRDRTVPVVPILILVELKPFSKRSTKCQALTDLLTER
ncbi:MAG: hypothetical protein ACNYPE_08405 [Candidatus Azotimanducaceae bacterium WSBS_2022_MAG_OTU7]